jgi:hypothetical protein
VQVRVEEELAFIDSSSLYRRIVHGSAALQEEAGGADAQITESEKSEQK